MQFREVARASRPSFPPGQYHLRKQMGSGDLLRLRIIPSAYAAGTDSGAQQIQLKLVL